MESAKRFAREALSALRSLSQVQQARLLLSNPCLRARKGGAHPPLAYKTLLRSNTSIQTWTSIRTSTGGAWTGTRSHATQSCCGISTSRLHMKKASWWLAYSLTRHPSHDVCTRFTHLVGHLFQPLRVRFFKANPRLDHDAQLEPRRL